MRETFHIFRKDVRRHWPEILVGLVLLGFYVRLSLKPPQPQLYQGGLFPLFRFSLEAVRPLTVFFWIFLSIRVVHGETLVGDRQWWTTKPYEWWSLLAAKELFLLVFLNLPLLGVQLYLLRHAGFPIMRNLSGILSVQLMLAVILILPTVALASVTRGFGQVMLGLGAIVLFLWFAFATIEKIPNNDMSFVAEAANTVAPLLLLGCILAAVGCQYSRRKTWLSRGLLAAGAFSVWTISALTPYGKLVERKYPIADHTWTPNVSLIIRKATQPTKELASWERFSTAPLGFRLKIAGIPEKHWVHVAGVRPILESTGSGNWDPGWEQGRTDFWDPEDQRELQYSIKRQDYERLKGRDLRLRMEVALTEYEESEPSDFVVKYPEASNEALGICGWNQKTHTLDCRKPVRTVQMLVSVRPAELTCPDQDHRDEFDGDVSHVLTNSSEVEPGFDPIQRYQLPFPLNPVIVFADGKMKTRSRFARLCTGAIVHLATPHEKHKARVVLIAEYIRIEDIVWQFDYDFEPSED